MSDRAGAPRLDPWGYPSDTVSGPRGPGSVQPAHISVDQSPEIEGGRGTSGRGRPDRGRREVNWAVSVGTDELSIFT